MWEVKTSARKGHRKLDALLFMYPFPGERIKAQTKRKFQNAGPVDPML